MKDVSLKNKNGIFYCGNSILAVYTLSENKEEHIYPYFSIGDGAFVDVGAHIGKYSIKFGHTRDNRIIAIEPDKYNFSLLTKNITLNNLTNIIPINKGAYSTKGKVAFYVSDKGEGLHSIFRRNTSWQETSIDVDTIDNIITELEFQNKIDLIKIDVEGAEIEVIKGALNTIGKDHPKLIIEVLKENWQNLNDIKTLLEKYNYKVVRLDEDNYFFS